MKRVVALLLGLLLLGAAAPRGWAAEPDAAPVLLAERKGPIIWQVDEEKRRMMENDMELLRLYNEAMAAKNRRNTIAMATAIPGGVLIAFGLVGSIFQRSMFQGWWDDQTGQTILISGMAAGGALVGVGIAFKGTESPAEKAYKKYMNETYQIIPILQITPQPGGAMASLTMRF
jgi:hypothetical protein